MSLPSWERGLKYQFRRGFVGVVQVAPLAGARIEIDHAPTFQEL